MKQPRDRVTELNAKLTTSRGNAEEQRQQLPRKTMLHGWSTCKKTSSDHATAEMSITFIISHAFSVINKELLTSRSR